MENVFCDRKCENHFRHILIFFVVVEIDDFCRPQLYGN
jgi:hypothetical protein